MTPLLIVVLANIVEFVLSLFVPSAFPGTRETLKVINGLVTVAVPVAILAGQVRGDVFAAVSLGRIVLGAGGRVMTPEGVQQMIGDALGDPTLTLGLWDPDGSGYVDPDGAPVKLERASPARGLTEIRNDDQPVAVLVHDPNARHRLRMSSRASLPAR